MSKTPFIKYTPRTNGNRSIEEAISEIQREMDVRKRLFDRWASEGRFSWTDGHDRLERHMTALKYLIAYSTLLDGEQTSSDIPHPDDTGLIPDFAVDVPGTSAAA
jgi:hypothetical protein